MKILQINCVYNNGSTGKIVANIHNELIKNNIESVVCYGRGEKVNEPNIYKTCGELYSKFNNLLTRLTGLMYGGCFYSTYSLISILKKEKPDIVHLHCINGYFVNIYQLITFLKRIGIKTVLTLHAEFMHTGNCGHALECEKWKIGCGSCPRLRQETKSLLFDRTHSSWQNMKRAFEDFDKLVVTSVSRWLMERAKQSPILADKHHVVVFNGIDTNIFHCYDTSVLRAKHGIREDEKVIFHATASFSDEPNHLKGGFYILELAKRMRGVRFIVAGSYDLNLVVPDNVILLGRVADQKLLAQYYSMADVTVLTSKKETFSMICVESICCGTPVVGFMAGAPEQISLPEYSEFVEYGNLNMLSNRLGNWMEKKANVCPQIISTAGCKLYSIDVSVLKYIQVYCEI